MKVDAVIRWRASLVLLMRSLHAADIIKVLQLHSWIHKSYLKRLRYLYYLLLFLTFLLSSSFQVHQRYPTPKHPPIRNLLRYQLEVDYFHNDNHGEGDNQGEDTSLVYRTSVAPLL